MEIGVELSLSCLLLCMGTTLACLAFIRHYSCVKGLKACLTTPVLQVLAVALFMWSLLFILELPAKEVVFSEFDSGQGMGEYLVLRDNWFQFDCYGH